MSQEDYNVANADGATVRADINSQLDAIVTNNSGGSEPSTLFANMWWYDTATNDLNQRNETNTAWVLVARKDGSGWTPYFGTTLLALATEIALGVAEMATQGEANAGTLDTKIITPLKLQGRVASETAKGLVEIATQAEADAGTDDVRFITAKKMKDATTTGFVSGTRMVFQQTGAPTGWTKEAVHDNKAMRLVTGSVGGGGATNFNTVFGTGKTTSNHTLSVAEIPGHSHIERMTAGGTNGLSGPQPSFNELSSQTSNTSTENTGGGGGHNHPLTNFNLKFLDFIIAIKD